MRHQIPESCPVTYRQLFAHETSPEFAEAMLSATPDFKPDDPVRCDCKFNEGHEDNCSLVRAHNFLELKKTLKSN